jgi:phage internal scaffolding protein
MEIRQKPNQKITIRKNGTIDISSINTEPTLTQQQFKEQCDINNIIKHYTQTGELPLSKKVGQFLDVSNVQDYQTALQTVFDAQKAFDNLPSHVRSKFHNDPNNLLAFIEDDSNYEEAIKLGLLNETAKSKIQNQNQNTNTANKSETPS